MNTYLCDDVLRIISQYSPEVYGMLRLMNNEVKYVIDEILPSGTMEQRIQFLLGAQWCGFKLVDWSDFDAWLDALDGVYGNEGISGEIVEKFCREYQKKAKFAMIKQNVLHVLCKYNRMEYLREVWNSVVDKEEEFCCDWMKKVGMLGDLVYVKTVYFEFLNHCKDKVKIKDVVRIAIQGAVECYQWKNISFLLDRHAEMRNDAVLRADARFVFASYNGGSSFGHGSNIFKYYDSLHKDRKFVLHVVIQDGLALAYANELLKRDRLIVLEAVKQNGFALQFADDSLKKDKEVVLTAALKLDGRALKYADVSFMKDKVLVLEAVKQNGVTLKYADDLLKKDKEVVLAAVNGNGVALRYADDSLKKDKEVVLAAVKQFGRVLEFADDSLKEDKEVVLAAVKQNGTALEFADDSLKKDKQFILKAMKQNGSIMYFADDSLKKDKEVVLAAVKGSGFALQYADDSLKKDKEVVLAAVKQLGLALQFADDSLKKDKGVVLAAVSRNRQALEYADDSLKNDLFRKML